MDEMLQTAEEITREREETMRRAYERSSAWKRYLISSAIAIALAVLIAWAVGAFSVESDAENVTVLRLQKWCDAFFIDGIVFLAMAGLLFCGSLGAYDTIAFGLRMAIGVMFRAPEKRKYKDLYEYKQDKAKSRPKFLYLLWIGLVLFAVSLALFIASKSVGA